MPCAVYRGSSNKPPGTAAVGVFAIRKIHRYNYVNRVNPMPWNNSKSDKIKTIACAQPWPVFGAHARLALISNGTSEQPNKQSKKCRQSSCAHFVDDSCEFVAGGGDGGDETTFFKGLSLRVHESQQIVKRLGDVCDKLMSHLTNAGRFITMFAEGAPTKMTVARRHRISADLTACGLSANCDGCGQYVNSVLISLFDEQSFYVEPYTDSYCMFSEVNLCVVYGVRVFILHRT